MTCCTTSIAFPMCWFTCDTADDNSALWTIGNSVCDAYWYLLRLTTLWANSIDGGVTIKCLPSVAGIQNSFTSKVPTGNSTRRRMECKTLGNSSKRRHYVDLTWTLFTSYKSKQFTIWRKMRVRYFAYSCG